MKLHASTRAEQPRSLALPLRTLGLALALGAALTSTTHAQTYYVDNQSGTCSDAGPGTESAPYCTINAAMAAHRGPGITILVKPGIYREQVTISAAGASASNFVFHAAGPGVVVDGSDDFANSALWAAASSTVWLAASVTWGPLQVFVDGVRLTPSTATPDLLPVHSFAWVSGQGLYVNLGGDNPGTHNTLVGHRLYGFNIFSKSWVTIDGFEITRVESRGVNIQNGCTDLIVSNNRVSYANSYGIQTVNGIRMLIAGNTVFNNNFHGIGLTAGASGCTVRDNECFGNADPIVRRANGIYLFGAPNNIISGNRIHDNQDSGLQLDRDSNANICFNNRSWHNGDHGYDNILNAGNVHVNDVAYGNFKRGFSNDGSLSGAIIYNCIAVDNGITTGEFDLWVDPTSTSGFTSDYNIFWNSTPWAPIKYVATQYPTIAGFTAATGQDVHSAQADPRFMNPAAGDFRLMPGSPAIDAANSGVPNWPATDAVGSARFDDPSTVDRGAGPITYADLGALEFSGPRVLAPAFVTVNEGQVLTVGVTAFDPSDPITSLKADLSGLPTANNATFTANSTNTAGTLRWTPTFGDSGTYIVAFEATGGATVSASTTIHVANVDRAPVVSSPSVVQVGPNGTVSFTVTAADPDGDPITSLIMVPTKLPANSGATLSVDASSTSGTFTWVSTGFSGNYKVSFVAANALTGESRTNIQIKKKGAAGADDAPSDAEASRITELAISNGFPNPSQGAIEFSLDMPQDARVRWTVFDLQGRVMRSEDLTLAAGRTQLRWDGRAPGGSPAPAGIYLVRAWVGDQIFTRRVIRL
jgi:parallel beta-helix repeat protein